MRWALLSLLPPIPSPEQSFPRVSLLQIFLSPHKWKVEDDRKKTLENETMFSYRISQNHPYLFCVVSSEWKKHILLEYVFHGATLPGPVWFQVVELRTSSSCTFQPGESSWMRKRFSPLLSLLFCGNANWMWVNSGKLRFFGTLGLVAGICCIHKHSFRRLYLAGDCKSPAAMSTSGNQKELYLGIRARVLRLLEKSGGEWVHNLQN